MESIKQYALALSFIALLILVKFVVVPVYQWQQETISSNDSLELRLTKSSYALNNKDEMKAALAKTSEKLSKIKSVLFNYQTKSKFQLAQQKKLELLFERHNIDISKVTWQLAVPLPTWQIIRYEVRFDIQGQVADLQKLQVTLDSQSKWYNNDNFNFRLDTRRDNNLGKASGRLSLKLYMQEKP